VGLNIPVVRAPDSAEAYQTDFEHLVQREAERLYRVALAIVDDPGEAEDAMQDTVVTAWRHRASLRGFANPTAWLTRVCINNAIRRRRGLVRRSHWLSGSFSGAGRPEPHDLCGELLDFRRAYQTLSPKQRALVALHIGDGYSLSECAQILGCRIGTAQSHLARARAKLRRVMTDG